MSTDIDIDELLDVRITQQLREALTGVGRDEARFLVDCYYQAQHRRIELSNQIRAVEQGADPGPDTAEAQILQWLVDRETFVERQVQSVLRRWAEAHEASRWALGIVGIGPVIASGLRAHIDITRAPTVGHIWAFAGLDPTRRWEKKTRRPWNADLKVLCWKAGESFIKVQNRDGDHYGQVYVQRKALEIERNESGAFAEQAAAVLAAKNLGHDTAAYAAYSTGKLPPAHIHARARRYAVKLFLAHYHHVAYEVEYGVPPPKPYIIEQRGHAHYLAPPNWPAEA
jgi:hypothetical protein